MTRPHRIDARRAAIVYSLLTRTVCYDRLQISTHFAEQCVRRGVLRLFFYFPSSIVFSAAVRYSHRIDGCLYRHRRHVFKLPRAATNGTSLFGLTSQPFRDAL